jgi:tetratricopeptide (TPR) repeat protein
VQDEIAGLIAKNLRLKLGAGSHAAATVNPEAYRLFLQGRAVVNREIPDDYAKAIQFLSDSLAIDGASALTWSWLSIAYTMSAAQGVFPAADGFERARQAAHKAIALDPMLASGHSALGCIMFAYDWDWDGSRRVLEKAEALAPGDSMTVSFLAQVAQAAGQLDRALELSRRGLELDPLNNLAGYVMGKSLFQARQMDEMVKLGEHMVGLNPTGFYGWVFQVYGHLMQGRYLEATRASEQIPRGFYRLVCLSHTLHALGRVEEAARTLSELKSVYGVTGAYQIAEIHGFRREPDLAFEWLENAIRVRDPGMTWLTNDAFFDAMSSDPRWGAILLKMKLPDNRLNRAAPPTR